jgi:hypothetical protein
MVRICVGFKGSVTLPVRSGLDARVHASQPVGAPFDPRRL